MWAVHGRDRALAVALAFGVAFALDLLRSHLWRLFWLTLGMAWAAVCGGARLALRFGPLAVVAYYTYGFSYWLLAEVAAAALNQTQ